MAATRNNIPSSSRTTTSSPAAGIRARVRDAVRARPRTAVALAVGAVVAIVAVVVAFATPDTPGRYEPPITARQYSAYTACLLTDSQGIVGPDAKPVWAAMQAASTATTAQVNYLAIQGEATLANADTYLNTLASRQCDLILAVGPLPDQVARERAAAYPKQHFILVDFTGSLPSNATAIQANGVQQALESSYQAWKKSGY
ncbi:hypothetical protein KDK95_08760 [Actinospica sp. MGRD01-02]|uniref:BMP family ABC transporter substrate-binding protein n=1 Tax=Actinospica acidithermotolerans TaxID=2828514 RepID=A0A941EA18_9ACTN|nr:hypothetical protein [Actinospica acidithermotolerans]MBR7826390.1 hypothetical protein [Actinospica acidithermotolerans]